MSGEVSAEDVAKSLGGCDSVLNQYWYTEHTISVLVAAMEAHLPAEGGRIAFMSTPSLFFAISSDIQANSTLLEYDKRWSGRKQFRFFDFNEGAAGLEDLWGSFDLCVIDPPYIDKAVWIKYLAAANELLKPEGDVLCTSIPENKPMLEACWQKLERGTHMQSHTFIPVNSGCLHRFAVFTTFPSPSLAVKNDEPVPESQGLGQQGSAMTVGEDEGEVDEVDGMFGGLQQAVISMHLDHNDSDHESEPEEDCEPEYEFNKKTGMVMRKAGGSG